MTLPTRDAVMTKNSVTKHNIYSVGEKIDESCNMVVWFVLPGCSCIYFRSEKYTTLIRYNHFRNILSRKTP